MSCLPAPETDPNGLTPSTPGAKLDAGKARPGLVLGGFSRALTEVAKVGTFGARKYTENGWIQVPNAKDRYEDAMLRHYLALKSGEKIDPDTGCLHAAHLAWNALAWLHFTIVDEE